MSVTFIRPTPPRLSDAGSKLRAIEDRRIFSNFGPVNTAFELDIVDKMFAGTGHAMTACNATIGLMLAIQQAIGRRPTRTRYALMPAFTFAAAAQAALWCGLTPLFCDIDPATWAASPVEEERLLQFYGSDIAVVVPYATFGYDIDLNRYEGISARYGVPVVVDAAASLGTTGADERGFGAGFGGTVVFSMHATKAFSTGEAGLIYSGCEERIRLLRQMANFGFGQARSATMPGLNGKLSEIGALLCQERLDTYEQTMQHRASIMMRYREALPELTFQPARAGRQAHQFGVGLLPEGAAADRAAFLAVLAEAGIGSATYFSPHLAQQSFFVENSLFGALPETDDVASRVICLPMFDTMSDAETAEVIGVVRLALERIGARRPRPHDFNWAAVAAE